MELAISRSFFLACVSLLAIVEQTCHILTVGFCKDPFAVLEEVLACTGISCSGLASCSAHVGHRISDVQFD
jgi:hypothetical protein